MKTRHSLTLLLVAIGLALLLLKAPWVEREDPDAVAPEILAIPSKKKGGDLADAFDEPLWEDFVTIAAAPDGEPVPLKTHGRVRLRPGQSAVVAFWQIQPDSNGLAIVTPEIQEDGKIEMTIRWLNLSDHAATDPAWREMLPAPLGMEQHGSLDSNRFERILAAAGERTGADMKAMPRLVTEPGRSATFQNRVFGTNGEAIAGYRMDLLPSTVTDDGSMNLDFRLEMP